MKKALLLSIAIAIVAAFFASANPDGLEKVAENFGFVDKAVSHQALMNYSAVGGVIGTLLVFGIFWSTAKLSKKM